MKGSIRIPRASIRVGFYRGFGCAVWLGLWLVELWVQVWSLGLRFGGLLLSFAAFELVFARDNGSGLQC